MEICTPNDSDYDLCRRIANARFDYHPTKIYYCENADNVKKALSDARTEKVRNPKLGVRIRSGGHQHEGMCSGNGVWIIDLSKINHIKFSDTTYRTVWIGAGAKLDDVYKETWAKNRILPGGGCGDVRVGGLVQGGGWGPYSRRLGFTCDQLVGFRMVQADGKEIEVTDAESDPDRKKLFWAVCGGGGGNFGVITEFKFTLAALPYSIWQFTISWKDESLRQPVIEEWRRNFPSDKQLNLTSFCRVSGSGGEDPPVIVAGFFMGNQAPLVEALQRMLPTMYTKGTSCFSCVRHAKAPELLRAVHHPEYQPGPPLAALRALAASAGGAPPDLSNTCAGNPFPHKVSSCFPIEKFPEAAVKTIVTYLADKTPSEPNVRRYLSLHCMGGKINDPNRNKRSCFAFRDKPYMLQYQAWWVKPEDKKKEEALEKLCLTWIKGFRETMKPYTEGAFINFPDKDLVPNPDTPPGRKALLQYYYAGNLDDLIRVKAKNDPGNLFDFEMGIPTK